MSRLAAISVVLAWIGVVLQRQLSRAGCWYDETGGLDARGIWVSSGCRADFLIRG